MTNSPGPYPAAGSSEDLLRRLRAWSVSSWRHRDRVAVARSALTELAALAAARRGVGPHEVPDIGAYALADQLTVLFHDAAEAGVPTTDLDAVADRLRRAWGAA